MVHDGVCALCSLLAHARRLQVVMRLNDRSILFEVSRFFYALHSRSEVQRVPSAAERATVLRQKSS